MPYNPGSAYPRKTVYTPPVAGMHSVQRAVNAPDVSSQAGTGGFVGRVAGRSAYASQAAQAAGAAAYAGGNTGAASMESTGIVGNLANRWKEQAGLQQNVYDAQQADSARSSTSMTGDPAAAQKRKSAGELSDQLVNGVLTGTMPGETGAANTRKGA